MISGGLPVCPEFAQTAPISETFAHKKMPMLTVAPEGLYSQSGGPSLRSNPPVGPLGARDVRRPVRPGKREWQRIVLAGFRTTSGVKCGLKSGIFFRDPLPRKRSIRLVRGLSALQTNLTATNWPHPRSGWWTVWSTWWWGWRWGTNCAVEKRFCDIVCFW